MKELSNDLFYPIMGITIAVVTTYYIKSGGIKNKSETWSSLVDSNNILYPNEKEITLKNKGKGVEITSIKKINKE